jgi:hypothetical protein
MAAKKTQVSIRLNDNTEVKTEIADFDSKKIAEILNDDSSNMIALGDVVLHRSTVVRVIPLAEKE